MGCVVSKSRINALIAEAAQADLENRRTRYAFDTEDTKHHLDLDRMTPKPASAVTASVPPSRTSLTTSSSPEPCSLARQCLDEVLPAADDQTAKRGRPIGPVGWKLWKTKRERQEFITSTLIVLSENGHRDIAESRIELFFPRVGVENPSYRAGLAVMDMTPNRPFSREAIATHTFAARRSAADRKRAFTELMLEIEALLAAHLLNANTHISRVGMGAEQRELELESRQRSRAFRNFEEENCLARPSDVAQAMNGVNEPYLRRPSVTTLPGHMMGRSRDYRGFVVGEVESHTSASSSDHTTGGVGAGSYDNWLRPTTQSRSRPRHQQILARRSPSSMNGSGPSQNYPSYTSYGSGHIGTRGYYGAQPQDRQHGSGSGSGGGRFMPMAHSGYCSLPPTIPSPLSDQTPSITSDPRSDTSSGPSQILQPKPITAIRGADTLDEAFTRLVDMPNARSPEPLWPHLVGTVPIIREPQPPARRRNSVASPTGPLGPFSCHLDGRLMSRSMKSRPNVEMRYFGLDRLEEDVNELKLFG